MAVSGGVGIELVTIKVECFFWVASASAVVVGVFGFVWV